MANTTRKIKRSERIYLAMEDFKDWNVLNVTNENGWIVVWLGNARIKFRNWKSETLEQHTIQTAVAA